MKHLIDIKDLSVEEINEMIEVAKNIIHNKEKYSHKCEGKKLATLFFEPSTRTHFSFASAQHQLGCQVEDFNAETSSVQKGETLYDTVKTFEAIGYDALVIRHPKDEYFKYLEGIQIPIINAGDGAGNHPSQCLLDLLTIYDEFNTFKDLNVVIIGDILHSRVAASDKDALDRLGANVVFAGPEQWQREGFPVMDLDEAIEWADVVMMLRIQKERGAALSGGIDYLNRYGLNKERYSRMKEHAIIMHPAPFNRGVEIDGDLVESEKSRIFKQMSNGVLVRKAIMKRAFGFEPFKEEVCK